MLVAPTSRSAGAASFRPQVVFAGDETRVLAEQLGAVDVQRLGRQAGRFTAEEMWRVDEALKTILGLSKPASPSVRPLRRYAEFFGVLVNGGFDGGERFASDAHLGCCVGAHVERCKLRRHFNG